MTDKLAEEILDEAHKISSAMPLSSLQKHFTYLAMQRYHEAKMKEVTDDDIISYAKLNIKSSIPLVEAGIIAGAKDFRDGKIVSSNRDITNG
jgi:hypothetical protein